MTGRHRWRLPAVLAVVAAAVTVGGCATASAAPPPPKATPQLTRALRAWSHFPVGALPRPLVLTGQQVTDPAGGFRTGAEKLAYLERAVTVPAKLPASPATADGYPVIAAQQALRVFTATAGSGPPPSTRLTIASMRLGTGLFPTDRGIRRLPAWLLQFDGVPAPAAVLAVAPAGIFTPPTVSSGHPFVTAAWLGSNGRTLTAEFIGAPAGTGPCTADYRLQVSASRTAVAVIVLESFHGGNACSAVGYARSATAALSAPLGARVVVDAVTGAAVPVTQAAHS